MEGIVVYILCMIGKMLSNDRKLPISSNVADRESGLQASAMVTSAASRSIMAPLNTVLGK